MEKAKNVEIVVIDETAKAEYEGHVSLVRSMVPKEMLEWLSEWPNDGESVRYGRERLSFVR